MPRKPPPKPSSRSISGLKPQNLVQAAAADIERRRRNEEIAANRWREPYEQYAFLKEHVKKGDGAFGIIAEALEHANKVKAKQIDPPKKRLSRIIYGDPELMQDALRLEKRK